MPVTTTPAACAEAVNRDASTVPMPHALVADDDPANRLILNGLVRQLGYRVTECGHAAAAVARCAATAFDVILMGVMLPAMGGITAVRMIKEQTHHRYVPVIFLTALSDDATITQCLAAGGDDFLPQPYSLPILRFKIAALRRNQQLQDRVAHLHAQQAHDEQFAEKLFSRAVTVGNYVSPALYAQLRPAARFSGDVYLSARAPSGEIYVLLGDFTGHGLSAAIGALPVSEVFRAMTAKGFAPEQILRAINRKLNTLFPTGLFMAAQFVAIDPSLCFIRVANCGMPDLHIFQPGSAQPVTAIVAHSLALGISLDLFLRDDLRTVRIEPGARVLLASDGLFEAVAPDGRAYGAQRALAAMQGPLAGRVHGLDRVLADLDEFCQLSPQVDDITAVEIQCDDSLFAAADSERTAMSIMASARGGWDLQMTLHGPRLGELDPVPLIMNQVSELAGTSGQDSALFTVLSELCVNALDHGVLELSSALKASPDGFERYMQERAARLATLTTGWVRIAVSSPAACADGAIAITIAVSDSGAGFDITAVERLATAAGSAPAPYGRGLTLVRALCDDVSFTPAGNGVQVIYRGRRAEPAH